ncbi:MAG: O-antigen ligase family protein [Candidatus Roizmanbacteria bacterium]|nr:MAG: O-antigen ligase family protein [Candidatus Roizmanbacteria bacterium]
MLTNIIRFLYYILFFATPLIVYSKTSELFEFNKMMFIYLITLLIVFIWLTDKITTKKAILKKNVFYIPIILFLVSQVLSTIFSIDIHTSLFGYYGRFNGGLFSIISYLVLFYIFIDVFDKSFIFRLLKISLISSVFVIILGLPGKFGYDLFCLAFTGDFNNSCWTDQFRPAERLFSTLGQPNWLGAYLSVLFFIGLYFLLQKDKAKIKKNIKDKIFYISYLILNLITIFFTHSQSAIAATIIALIIFISFRVGIKKSVIMITGLIFLILFFKTGKPSIDKYFSFSSKTTINSVQNKYSTSIVTDSFDIRKIVWKGAVEIGKSYPLFGTGVETFANSYYFKRPVEHNLTSEWDFLYNKAHNEFLNYFATTGYIGLSAYLIMIFSVLLLLFKRILSDKNNSLLFLSLFCAYISILITNSLGFSTTTINLFFYIIPAIIIALYTNYPRNKKIIINLNFKKDKKQTISLGLITLVFLIILSFLIKYYIADIVYAKSETYYKVGDYKTASSLLSQSLGLHYEHVYEDKLSYNLANLSYVTHYQKDAATAKNLVKLSDYYNLKSIKSSPYNVTYWKTRAKNQYLFYQGTVDSNHLNKGIEALVQAKRLSPTDPKIPYSIALYYTLLDDDSKDKNNDYQKKSLKEIEEAINLKPNFEDAYFLKGQLFKKYGQNEEAKKIFEFLLKKVNPQYEEAKKELETP